MGGLVFFQFNFLSWGSYKRGFLGQIDVVYYKLVLARIDFYQAHD